MAGVARHTEGWQMLPWKGFQRNVFRLQQRIYRAAQRRLEAGPQLTAAAASLLVGAVPGRSSGDAGESGQAHTGRGWSCLPHAQTTVAVGPESAEPLGLAGRADSPDVHSQTGNRREARPGHSGYG